MAIGEESEVTNAMEAVGQGVEQEAPDELVGLQTHGLLRRRRRDSPHMGSFGSRGRFVHASSSSLGWFGFDYSVFVSVGRYFTVCSWQRKRRALAETCRQE